MSCNRSVVRNERGATLALVAITMFLFLALAAVAIDLGMVKSSDAQAQRAADAAALAGASAFIDFANSASSVIDSAATARATDYATRHFVRTTRIASSEVTVSVIDADEKVRVVINRASMPVWFANTLGITSVRVSRQAAAVASNVGTATNCVKPFLMPDRWQETDFTYEDVNSNSRMDATGGQGNRGEAWFFQPPGYGPQGGDRYEAYNSQTPSNTQTGYGSGASGLAGDRGLSILLKPQTGNAQRTGNAYQLLDVSAYGLPNNLRQAVNSACIAAAAGDTARFQPGSNTGPARQGVQDLIAMSPDVTWDNTAGHPTATATYADWTQNPRVIVVALYNPNSIALNCDASRNNNCTNNSPSGTILFGNFARVYLDADPGNTGNISAKFIGFLGGGTGGATNGPLLKVLRLVE